MNVVWLCGLTVSCILLLTLKEVFVEHPFEDVTDDLAVMKAVIMTETKMTSTVVNMVWRWFPDVELILPIPDMGIVGDEWKRLTETIVDEMIFTFDKAGVLWEANPDVEDVTEVAPEEVLILDSLWRELAGCFAVLINEDIPQIPEVMAVEIYENAVEQLASAYEMDPEEVREAALNNVSFRTMLRRQGLDPDRVR